MISAVAAFVIAWFVHRLYAWHLLRFLPGKNEDIVVSFFFDAFFVLVVLPEMRNQAKKTSLFLYRKWDDLGFFYAEKKMSIRIHWGKVAVVVMSLMLMASLWYEWNGGW